MKNLDFESGNQTEVVRERVGLAFENCQRIERTIRYMTQHLDQPLHASDLAALANISLSHYFALFKRATGCGPIDFLIQLRMKRARQLLETTSLNIKEIADKLGYDDPFYFSRVFKSVNGMAPTEYRKVNQPVINIDRARSRPDPGLGPGWNAVRHNRISDGKQTMAHSASATF